MGPGSGLIQCTRCGLYKAPEGFRVRRSRPKGYYSWCIMCDNSSIRQESRLKRSGWTVEAFNASWEAQGGRCANEGCRVLLRPVGKAPDSVAADHDHTTGKPRALLCMACNKTDGNACGSPERLRGLADYIEKHAR